MDFLTKFDLSILPAKRQVLHAGSGRTLSQASKNSFANPWSSETAAAVAALPPQVQKLLEEFPSLLRPNAAQPKPLHGVVHHIDTGSAAPVFARPRRLDPEKHRIAEEEFLSLLLFLIFRFAVFRPNFFENLKLLQIPQINIFSLYR